MICHLLVLVAFDSLRSPLFCLDCRPVFHSTTGRPPLVSVSLAAPEKRRYSAHSVACLMPEMPESPCLRDSLIFPQSHRPIAHYRLQVGYGIRMSLFVSLKDLSPRLSMSLMMACAARLLLVASSSLS
ncbi:hypothetical protein AVEN_232483-1 [Araneus ventricosus]|uniref:Secreted protein n=1 Tax=Araneus ventricosus TaxID=182803 RepID=A0A4Y2QRK9_ARAVE|nr:hypothetical protein AVEN_232483-1 [Araneus ventricosus]